MRNIKIVLAYDGTNYAGWQRQKYDPSIQGIVEEKISIMTGTSLTLHGAGRTDAGVHALEMTANFKTSSTIPSLGFQKGLNSLLPDDIRVLEVMDADPDFHARFSALGKTYTYHITTGPVSIPTERLYTHHVSHPLNSDCMRDCLEKLVGEHDFSSFEAAGSRDVTSATGRGATRTIFSAECISHGGDPNDTICIEISGNGFLRHMVRNIVGTLIEAGLGKMDATGFQKVMDLRDRSQAGPTAPARGLFLKKVFY